MNKTTTKLLLVVFVLSMFITGFNASRVMAYTPCDLYDKVWVLINNKFVDQTNNGQDWQRWRHKYDNKIKTNEDAYVAIDTMLASLNDPYTRFLDPKEFAEETTSIKGSLKGIGTQISIRDGKLVVVAPIENSPAEKAGVKADDEILEINGESTKGISVDKAADKIRGEKGTTVNLLIKRKGEVNPLRFIIVRDEIEVKAVSTTPPMKTTIPENIQYIRLSTFISQNAGKEVGELLLKNRNKQGYIIDLRSNPGGLLTNAVLIANMLLKGGVIVSTVDRDGYKETARATNEHITSKPIVILVDKGSASASEILSGAMKDNGRATLVGTQTFGKGIVQEINKLPEGSGVNITIQRYLTPNGNDIHKKGITPDIIVELSDEDIKNKKDAQLLKGIEVLTQKINNCRCSR